MSASLLIKTIGLVLALGFDTFAVSVGLGISGLSRRDRYRYGATFALAEAIMPLVGFLIGQVVAGIVGRFASYGAVFLLLGIGLYTVWEATQEDAPKYEATSLLSLLMLGLSVSLDELAVGFSLGLIHIPILTACILIGLQAFVLTWIGTALGRFIGARVAGRAGVLSGGVLTLLALYLLGENLFSP